MVAEFGPFGVNGRLVLTGVVTAHNSDIASVIPHQICGVESRAQEPIKKRDSVTRDHAQVV